MRAFACLGLVVLLFGSPIRQSTRKPTSFDIAEIRVSRPTMSTTGGASGTNPFMKGPFLNGTRYEIRSATMLDLIQTAYGLQADEVVGGPGWLELDRFDISAKVPPETTRDLAKSMLQTLLADRFKLKVHNDSRPLPAYVLTVGKKPFLKPADGSGETGCKAQPPGPPIGSGSHQISINGTVQTIVEPAPTVFSCRNITMDAFVKGMSSMTSGATYLNNNRFVNQTGLTGGWDFDIKFLLRHPLISSADSMTIFDAIQKLGLELSITQVPLPVTVVDSVNSKPIETAARSLPALPTEFEVADIKPTAPESQVERFQIQPGGRVNIQGMTLKALIERAWDINSDEMIAGPKFLDTERFNIIAKAPTFGPEPNEPSAGSFARPAPALVDQDSINQMLRTLLIGRFRMVFHNEERQVTAFELTALKPRMKPADPADRMRFHEGPGPDGKDPRSVNPMAQRLVTFQNMTMAQFAEALTGLGGVGYLHNAKVYDATGLVGGWDFSLNFSSAAFVGAVPIRGGTMGGSSAPEAPEPNGAITLFEAIEKQLGLKLVPAKHAGSVLIIDHIEQKPAN